MHRLSSFVAWKSGFQSSNVAKFQGFKFQVSLRQRNQPAGEQLNPSLGNDPLFYSDARGSSGRCRGFHLPLELGLGSDGGREWQFLSHAEGPAVFVACKRMI